MARAFMYGTKLQEMEQMMMSVPNFTKRGKGVFIIERIQYSATDLECRFCSEYKKCKGNDATCIILKERISANAVSYQRLVQQAFKENMPRVFRKRADQVTQKTQTIPYFDEQHKERLEAMAIWKYGRFENTPSKELAILFLLTANEDIYQRMKDCSFGGTIDFERMNLRNISIDSYALYQAARTIRFGKEYIHIDEIVDPQLVDDKLFRLMVTAMLIVRYGYMILNLQQ